MKSIKINIALVAMLLGVTAAFAFKAPTNRTTNYWFDTTAAGVPTTYDADGPQCSDPSGDFCAKEYRSDQLNFSGSTPVSVKSGQENMQIASEHILTK